MLRRVLPNVAKFLTIRIVPIPRILSGETVMRTMSQVFGRIVAVPRFALVAAMVCGVLAGPFARDRAARAEDPSAAAVERGLVFLAARQHDDGSYGMDVYRGHVAVTAFVSRAMMAAGSKPGEGPYGERLSKGLAYLLRPRAGKRADPFPEGRRAGPHVRACLRADVPGRVPEGRPQGRDQGEDRAGGEAHRQVAEQGRRLARICPSRRTPISR